MSGGGFEVWGAPEEEQDVDIWGPPYREGGGNRRRMGEAARPLNFLPPFILGEAGSG